MEDIKDIKQDLKDISTHISHIKETLITNTVQLEIHMKRTDLNEKRIAKVEYAFFGLLVTIIGGILKLAFK